MYGVQGDFGKPIRVGVSDQGSPTTSPLLYFSTFLCGSIPNVSFIQTHSGGSDDTPDAANASLLIACAFVRCPDMHNAYT